jgi:hypothetical protein
MMPEIAPFSYIIDLLVEMGVSGLTWQEISSWCNLTGITLTMWESTTIKKLSAIYDSCAQRYNNAVVSAPYRSIEHEATEDDQIKLALRNSNLR